jgi:RND family efflux transporter MFP subunit
MKRFLTAKTGALVVLLTLATAWVWAHEGHQPLPTRGATVDAEKGLITLSASARAALEVKTGEVKLGTLEERVVAPAVLVAPWQRYAYATSRIEGKVAAIHVRPGEKVRQGQPLADVQSLELENLQLELLNAQNDIKLSAANLAQFEKAAQSVAEQQILEARSKHQENINNLEIARRKLLSLGIDATFLDQLQTKPNTKQLQTLPILSPISGEVVHAEVQVGQVIQPTEHLIDVVDLSAVWVQISVLEKDWPRIEVGQQVELRLSAYPGEVLRGSVQVKGLGLDPQTHQGTVWATLAPLLSDHRLLPGMVGQTEVILPSAKKTLQVPATAVIRDGAERYVLVEEGPGQYARTFVTIGLQRHGVVEIKRGSLVPGDRVVTTGSHELATLLPQGVLRLSKEAEQNIGLRVEPVQKRSVAQTLQLNGSVDLLPGRKAVVSARLPGSIQRIHVDRSQTVIAGQVIAEVASMELQNLQLELLRQHLQVELLELTLQRLRPLAEKGNLALSPRKLRETESAYNAARQRRDSLERKLEAVGLSHEQVQEILNRKKLQDSLPIRAPIGGVIVSFQAELGHFVKAEEPLFEIHDLSRPVIRGYVTERELPRIAIGQTARIRLPANQNFLAEGTVVRSGQVFGSTDRTLSVWVELKEPPKQPLLYGMLARLTLVAGEGKTTLTVPRQALLREGSRSYVFVRQADGAFARRRVEMGQADDQFVEIKRGVSEGEAVAVQGVDELQTGYASLK